MSKPGRRWEKIILETGMERRPAMYHPNMTRYRVEQLEMSFLNGGWHEILPHPKPHVRMFWREVLDMGFPVGASLGSETNFVYVEYNSSGPVHGRPMLWQELLQKGAIVL